MRENGTLSTVRRRATCSLSGCSRHVTGLGYCSTHYQRFKKYGDPLVTAWVRNTSPPSVCTVDGCDSPHARKGMCHRHANAEYWRANPERAAQIRVRYRTRKSASMTSDDKAESLEYRRSIASDRCVYCGSAAETVDHIQPLKLGGTDHACNLAPSCGSCNFSKGAKPLLQFLLYRMGVIRHGRGVSPRGATGSV